MHLLNVLTQQIPWPGDLDLYFGCSDIDIIYVNVPDLLKYKTSSHQTLHSVSPRCTDSAGILTRWPWPVFCTPVTLTHFTLIFGISSNIRPTNTKTLTYILHSSAFYTFCVDVQYLLNYKAYNHQTLHSASPKCTDSAGTLTRWPWPIFCAPLTFTPFT